MRGVWENINELFNRIERRESNNEVRLYKLERLMQDFVGAEPGHTITSAVGAFDVVEGDKWKDDRHYRFSEVGFEAESQRRAEKLRTSFRPARLKKRCFSHVRDPRPIPTNIVQYAKRLGVAL